jgi:hypothetical protein
MAMTATPEHVHEMTSPSSFVPAGRVRGTGARGRTADTADMGTSLGVVTERNDPAE